MRLKILGTSLLVLAGASAHAADFKCESADGLSRPPFTLYTLHALSRSVLQGVFGWDPRTVSLEADSSYEPATYSSYDYIAGRYTTKTRLRGAGGLWLGVPCAALDMLGDPHSLGTSQPFTVDILKPNGDGVDSSYRCAKYLGN